MKCSFCNEEAVVSYGFARPLCKKHFIREISSRIRKNLRKELLIKNNKKTQFLIVNDNTVDSLTLSCILEPILKQARRNYDFVYLENRYDFKALKAIQKRTRGKAIVLLPWTCNDTTSIFMNNLFNGMKPCKGVKEKTVSKRVIKPLESILDSESFLFAKFSVEAMKKSENHTKNNSGNTQQRKLFNDIKQIQTRIQTKKLSVKEFFDDKSIRELSDILIKKYNKPLKEVRYFLNAIEEKHPGTNFAILNTIRKICGR